MSQASDSLFSPPIFPTLAIEVDEAFSAMLLLLNELLGRGVAEDAGLLLRGRRTA